jgi:5-hydroxyisourate hydrolase-like protein (transthyretin family)
VSGASGVLRFQNYQSSEDEPSMKTLLNAVVFLFLQIPTFLLLSCSESKPVSTPATQPEPEAIARTEFTDRLENFFEYEPLRSGKPSQVRIHLTDLRDGSPVEKADVSMTVKPKGKADPVLQTTAKVGKVTGIYVAEWNIPQAGEYDIEFHIRNNKLDEHLPLMDFKVE